MNSKYSEIVVTIEDAKKIVKEIYNLEGEITKLPGFIDFNFKIKADNKSFLLKVSRPDFDKAYITFQNDLLVYLVNTKNNLEVPKPVLSSNSKYIYEYTDHSGNKRMVRMLTWIDGRLWSSVNPQKNELLFSLGKQTGLLTKVLQDFQHDYAHREFEWDTAQAEWTYEYLHLFENEQRKTIEYFQYLFKKIQEKYNSFRKSIVHNDANDNNIVVSKEFTNPDVKAIIDYGDAVYTQTINDLSITIAYAVMNKPDVLQAALPIIKGYHEEFNLLEEELEVLYVLVAMRLVVSITNSAINREKEPNNEYLLISEKPAWDVLKKWKELNRNIATYSFRNACGFKAHPQEGEFKKFAEENKISINTLFPTIEAKGVINIDMSVASSWLGNESEYNDTDLTAYKIVQLQKEHPKRIIAGGYLETRPFYDTKAYIKEGNSGPEYRNTHLGIDFWMPANTPVHSIFDGIVFSIYNNDNNKDYGPTLILEHNYKGIKFFSLYGHLARKSMNLLEKGQKVSKGDLIAYVGESNENGNWAPHLHFQIMHDMLGNKTDFPGACFYNEIDVWSSICPDPNMFFNEKELLKKTQDALNEILSFRKEHLGKSLSISYDQPLHMVRGNGVFLIDTSGRKYLDTVNNVAHVGHEHPRVVKAGQKQMAILNTNTRYLHENINEFAEELLNTFPPELSVAHFVNSGSEANELAMRMAYNYTGQKDMIAVEIGYHGNTNGCINISSYKFDGKGGTGAPEHTHIVPMPDTFRGLYQGKDTGKKYAAHIEEQLKNIKAKGRNVAAFICESIISCGGQTELPKDYLKYVYAAVRKEGGLCISDDVQVGCGRVGSKFWGFELHDVVPDIVTVGKPIGNGHPLAAVVCTKEVAEAFANGMEYFNTFGGNPVSCAIGREVLRTIKDEKLQENARNTGNYLKSELMKLQKEFPIIGEVRGQGLFLGFELNNNDKSPLTEKASYLANRMRDFGILMSTDGKDNNVLKIKPPIVFSKENADELIYRLRTVFKEDFIQK